MLRKAGELADGNTRRVTTGDLSKQTTPSPEAQFVTVNVIRPGKNERTEYTVPVEKFGVHSAALPASSAHD